MNDEVYAKTTIAASIVVPTRGGAHRLPLLLESLDRQTRRDFEVVVVVDGDIDGTAELLNDWVRSNPAMLLRTVVFPENRGRSAALNAGHQAARGEVIVRCDDDLEPAPDYVDLHIRSHTGELSGVIGLYANVLPDTTYARVYGKDADHRFRQAALSKPENQWRYWAGNVSMTRATWQLVGGYDEDYRRYGWEDVDYGYRLHEAGVPVRIVAELTTRHHVAATTTAMRVLRALHSGASRHLFLQKHRGAPLSTPAEGSSPWNFLVRVLSHRITEGRVRIWGDFVDRAGGRLPRPVARKLVALLVESAARAGIEDPARAHAQF